MALSVKELRSGACRLVDDEGRSLADVNRFLAALEIRGLSPRTVRAYAFDCLALYRWLEAAGKAVATLRQPDLLDFVAAQRAEDAQPSSINRRLVTCRLLYRFITGQELPDGPGALAPSAHYTGRGRDRSLGLHLLRRMGKLKLRVKQPRKIVEPLSREQVCAFLRSLRRYRDLAIVHLMLLCGLRSQEVLALCIRDVSFEERQLRVRGKGGKERILPLPDLAVLSLGDYLRFERPARCKAQSIFVVLQGRLRGCPMTAAGLRSLFRQRRRNADLAVANPHRFRHTFGADMARAGVRLPFLQRLMGHASAQTTLGYVQLSMSDLADEYRRALREIQKRYPSESS